MLEKASTLASTLVERKAIVFDGDNGTLSHTSLALLVTITAMGFFVLKTLLRSILIYNIGFA